MNRCWSTSLSNEGLKLANTSVRENLQGYHDETELLSLPIKIGIICRQLTRGKYCMPSGREFMQSRQELRPISPPISYQTAGERGYGQIVRFGGREGVTTQELTLRRWLRCSRQAPCGFMPIFKSSLLREALFIG